MSIHSTAPPREFLSFKLGSEEYGIDILKVQEIRAYERPTRIADVPAFIKGVVNLRGIIVPIIDLRIKFKLERCDYDDFTVVIVLNVAHRVIGVVVDGVCEVTTLAADQIKPAPDFADAGPLDTGHVIGLATLGQRMLILIDIEKLMSARDGGLVGDTADAAERPACTGATP